MRFSTDCHRGNLTGWCSVSTLAIHVTTPASALSMLWQQKRGKSEPPKKKPLPSCEDNGFYLVVQCNTTPNAHPEVMSKWAEKIQVSE